MVFWASSSESKPKKIETNPFETQWTHQESRRAFVFISDFILAYPVSRTPSIKNPSSMEVQLNALKPSSELND